MKRVDRNLDRNAFFTCDMSVGCDVDVWVSGQTLPCPKDGPVLGGDPLDAALRILSPVDRLLFVLLLLLLLWWPEKDELVWRFSVRIVRMVEMSEATRFSNWSSCLKSIRCFNISLIRLKVWAC